MGPQALRRTAGPTRTARCATDRFPSSPPTKRCGRTVAASTAARRPAGGPRIMEIRSVRLTTLRRRGGGRRGSPATRRAARPRGCHWPSCGRRSPVAVLRPSVGTGRAAARPTVAVGGHGSAAAASAGRIRCGPRAAGRSPPGARAEGGPPVAAARRPEDGRQAAAPPSHASARVARSRAWWNARQAEYRISLH